MNPDGDLAAARDALEQALALTPSFRPANYYLGLTRQAIAARLQVGGGDPRPMLKVAVEQLNDLGYLPILNAKGQVLLDLEQAEWERGGDPDPSLKAANEA